MEVVELLIAHSEKDLSRFAKYYFVNTADQLRAHDYSEINQMLFGFLDKLEAHYKAVQKKSDARCYMPQGISFHVRYGTGQTSATANVRSALSADIADTIQCESIGNSSALLLL